jgi:GTP-binding protein
VSFSHLPKQPRGGPDGGDGGRGGDVYFQASEEYHSLGHLQKDAFLKAEDGSPGGKNKRHGKNGKDLIIYIPPGTTVWEENGKEPMADLVSDGEKIKVAEGGEGGKGNINFATSTNQAPRIAIPGKDGEAKALYLIFSPNVDIIVIGPPNSGKSSLVARITGNSLKIASYPFTTKKPHLWSYMHNFSRYTFMDTPPLVPETIEDIKILLRRAQTLLIVIDGSRIEEFKKKEKLVKEIEEYSEKDSSKKIAYVLAKNDKVDTLPRLSTLYPTFPVSIEKDDGIDKLKVFLFGQD